MTHDRWNIMCSCVHNPLGCSKSVDVRVDGLNTRGDSLLICKSPVYQGHG